eukprot:1181395-Prorocentrum_minimum.AAC.3
MGYTTGTQGVNLVLPLPRPPTPVGKIPYRSFPITDQVQHDKCIVVIAIVMADAKAKATLIKAKPRTAINRVLGKKP